MNPYFQKPAWLLEQAFLTEIVKKPHGEISLPNSITQDYFCPKPQRTGCIFQAAFTYQARPNFRKLEPRPYPKHKSIRLHT